MQTVLVTGANRGLGLEFVRQYAADGAAVIAANRTPFAARDLAALGPGVSELRYDALAEGSAEALVRHLGGRPLDIVIVNAGLDVGPDLPPEAIDRAAWEPVMLANAFAPLRLASLLAPNLRAGERKVLAAVSSLAASSVYERPRHFAYSASKAALNQIWRTLAVDCRDWGCLCLMLRPGRVATRMTGFAGELTAAESVAGLRRVIDGATAADSGCHIGYDGVRVPW